LPRDRLAELVAVVVCDVIVDAFFPVTPRDYRSHCELLDS